MHEFKDSMHHLGLAHSCDMTKHFATNLRIDRAEIAFGQLRTYYFDQDCGVIPLTHELIREKTWGIVEDKTVFKTNEQGITVHGVFIL